MPPLPAPGNAEAVRRGRDRDRSGTSGESAGGSTGSEGHPLIETELGAPAIESFVRNGDLVLRADLPGIDPKDVDVHVLGNVLTIKGERRDKKEAKEDDYIRREVAYGSFQRQFTLPQGVDGEKVRAKYENGVLEVTMPAPKEMSPKKVSVSIGKV